MDVKGQGALEYLLLIGGAVLVAAIVIALITGIPTTITDPEANARCATMSQWAVCEDEPAGTFSAGGSTWTCEAMQSDGITDALSQADMSMCKAIWVSTP